MHHPAQPLHTVVGGRHRHPAAGRPQRLLGLLLDLVPHQIAQPAHHQPLHDLLRNEPLLLRGPPAGQRTGPARPAEGKALQRRRVAPRGGEHQQRIGRPGLPPGVQQRLEEVVAQWTVDVVQQHQTLRRTPLVAATRAVRPPQIVQEGVEEHCLGPLTLGRLAVAVALVEVDQKAVDGTTSTAAATDTRQPPAHPQPHPVAPPLRQQRQRGGDRGRGAQDRRGVRGELVDHLRAAARWSDQRFFHLPNCGVPVGRVHPRRDRNRQQTERREAQPGEVPLLLVELEDQRGQHIDRFTALLAQRRQIEPSHRCPPGPVREMAQHRRLTAATRPQQQRGR